MSAGVVALVTAVSLLLLIVFGSVYGVSINRRILYPAGDRPPAGQSGEEARARRQSEAAELKRLKEVLKEMEGHWRYLLISACRVACLVGGGILFAGVFNNNGWLAFSGGLTLISFSVCLLALEVSERKRLIELAESSIPADAKRKGAAPGGRRCPFCSGANEEKAEKCGYCGSDLRKKPAAPRTHPPAAADPLDSLLDIVNQESAPFDAIIKRDVPAGEQLAFTAGERVEVESITPDPERPECKYTVLSAKLDRRFRLSDKDIEAQ